MIGQKISISGTVKDSSNNKPIPYVNIQVENSNHGTACNLEGDFQLQLDSASYTILFSCIGYLSQTIHVEGNKTVVISLEPKVYKMNEVIVDNLTWSEKFILEAVRKNKIQIEQLNYYTADVYSKTTFATNSLGIFGLAESISQIQFLEPDLYREDVEAIKISPNLRALPYRVIAVNQSINLANPASKIWSFYIVNPLVENTFDYYNFYLLRKTSLDQDTVVVLSITPKENNAPLFEGELYFLQKNHRLIEAKLKGNSEVHGPVFDSLQVYQTFSLKDSIFNLPSFTKFTLNMNTMGFVTQYQQEYTAMNYSINKPGEKPFIVPGNTLVEENDLDMDLDFKRNEFFKVPYTEKEKEFNKKIKKVFVEGSFYKRVFLYFFTNFLPTIIDQPSNFGNYKFSKFSNLYRFNKAEGHYLGFEYNIYDNELTNIRANTGYSFGAKTPEFDFHFRWKYISLDVSRRIENFGDFKYIKTLQTFDALLYHSDDMNYMKTFNAGIDFELPLFDNLSIMPYVKFEKQSPVENTSEFSIFSTDKIYKQNFLIPEYSNHRGGLLLRYVENEDYEREEKRVYIGDSFMNIMFSVEAGNKNLLKSTENTTEWNFNMFRYQEVYGPVKLGVGFSVRHLTGSNYINKMSVVNKSETFEENRSLLSFYTLENYDFVLKDYLRITSDLTLFTFPPFLGFSISVGGLYTFLRPMDTPVTANEFNTLNKNFMEYGLAIKGISMLNLYFLKNNLYPSEIYVRLDFTM